MRLTLLHPPHTAIGSRVPKENLPPFGLLCVAGPLIDAGHHVRLVNADPGNLPLATAVRATLATRPDAVLIGHSGSTSVHPTVLQLAQMLKSANPALIIIYGGVFPSYHWHDILTAAPAIDIIVRGEGEATTPALIAALAKGAPLATIPGIAYRD
ncbi:MAG: B12-binding domain-containing radical SAM protein, partial [Paracoccaceae bacterium]